jgi:hypothetical protein
LSIAEDFWVLRFRLMVERGPYVRPQASEGKAQHEPFCWTGCFGQGDQRLHLDDTGKILREVKVASEHSALAKARLPVVCVETRHMQAVLKAQINKTDRNDARSIAQMMGVELYRPVHVKTLRSQKLRMLLTHRKLLQKFQALQRSLDSAWHSATSDKDLEHLKEYVGKIKDTKFRQRLTAAVKDFYASGKRSVPLNDPTMPSSLAYETNVVAVYEVPDYAASKYGFHFKDTDEFGLYAWFHDDGDDKTYESFYRTDHKFRTQNILNCLHLDAPI